MGATWNDRVNKVEAQFKRGILTQHERNDEINRLLFEVAEGFCRSGDPCPSCNEVWKERELIHKAGCKYLELCDEMDRITEAEFLDTRYFGEA